MIPRLHLPCTYCVMLTKRQLWNNRASSFFLIPPRANRLPSLLIQNPPKKTASQWKATMGLQKMSGSHLSMPPHSQTPVCVCALRIRKRSGKLKRPLPHAFPVWQHFTKEADATRKTGHTTVRFSQLNSLEMGQSISWQYRDTVTECSCFGWVDLHCVEIFC